MHSEKEWSGKTFWKKWVWASCRIVQKAQNNAEESGAHSRWGRGEVTGQKQAMQRTAVTRWYWLVCFYQNMLVSTTPLGYGIPLKDGDEKTDEEADGPFSEDEMLTHKGLRRSQSMKSVKTMKGRKEVSQL